MRRNQRSEEAKAWRGYYATKAWREARAAQLRKQPTCERCEKRGKLVLATVCNHRTPHKGDWALFIDPDNHESVCAPCHDGEIQQTEKNGYSLHTGADGIPTDPNHPWNLN